MAKKNFDDFLESVEKPKRPTPEEAAQLVAMVHGDTRVGEVPLAKPPAQRKAKPAAPPTRKEAPPAAAKRGRPRAPRNETERLYRLSVDLPGSLLLKLKGAAMEEGTDMKTYVRNLLAEHLVG
jgi:hypothetical protein